MPPAAERAAAIRRGAGLFQLGDRGLLAVEGRDRVRWLNGMLTRDVAELDRGAERRCGYALLLDPKGRIAADAHVLPREAALWLDVEADALVPMRERLERYIVADDVRLSDASQAVSHTALEGAEAPGVLARISNAPAPEPGACLDATLAGLPVLVAAYGWSGAPAYQLFASASDGEALRSALRAAGEGALEEGDAEVLEILRIEAGIPRLGAELDEEVFPAEAGLVDRAVSLEKGCFTGQEIVARIESRGGVNHRLVGFRLELAPGEALPSVDSEVSRDGKRVGELTSVCHSSVSGPIGLGYVRLPLDAPGTEVRVAGQRAQVAALPFEGADGTAIP